MNRSEPAIRQRLTFLLQEYWIESNYELAQEIARKVIARCRLLDGAPAVPKGVLKGYIAIGTGFGREARLIPSIGRRFFYLLNAQLDTSIMQLGRHDLYIPADSIIKAAELYPNALTLPLFAPIMAKCQEDPISTGLIMVFSQREIIDLIDLESYSTEVTSNSSESTENEAFVWPKQIIITDLGKKIPRLVLELVEHPYWEDTEFRLAMRERQEFSQSETEWVPKLFKVPPEYLQYSTRPPLEYAINQTLAKRFKEPIIIERVLRSFASLNDIGSIQDFDELRDAIDQLIPQIDQTSSMPESDDYLRYISSGILILAQWDFPRCVDLIFDWLACDDELKHSLGITASKLLFITLMLDSVPVETHSSLFRLAPALAKADDWDGVKHVLWLIRNWLNYPQWGDPFKYFSGDLAYIFNMADHIDPIHYKKAAQILFTSWANPIKSNGEEEVPEITGWVARKIANRLISGAPKSLPDLSEVEKFGVILLDFDTENDWETNEESSRLVKAFRQAVSVLKSLDDVKSGDFKYIVFKVGRTNPVFVSGEDNDSFNSLAEKEDSIAQSNLKFDSR